MGLVETKSRKWEINKIYEVKKIPSPSSSAAAGFRRAIFLI